MKLRITFYLTTLILFAGILPQMAVGQCAVDPNATGLVDPENESNLPPAKVGILYTQDFNISVPADTTFPIVGTVPIDSAVLNLANSTVPAGLSLFCKSGGCTYLGGSKSCFQVTGTPNVVASETLSVQFVLFGQIAGTTQSRALDLTFYLDVENANSIIEADGSGFAPAVFPNPASDEIQIEAEVGSAVSILDLLGNVVYKSTLQEAKTSVKLTDQFSNGYYLVGVENQLGQRSFQKVKVLR